MSEPDVSVLRYHIVLITNHSSIITLQVVYCIHVVFHPGQANVKSKTNYAPF